MSELDEFAEALMGQLSVEIDEEKEIAGLAKKIKEDRGFTVEFDDIESVSQDVFPDLVQKVNEYMGLEVSEKLSIEFLKLDEFKRLKGKKVFTENGRVYVDKLFDYDVCCLKTLCYDDKHEMKFHDNCILEPKKQTMNSLGIFGNKTAYSMMYVVTKQECIEELYETINQLFKDNDEIIGGTSILPNNSGLSVRVLSNSSELNKITVYNIAQIVRKQIIHNVKH